MKTLTSCLLVLAAVAAGTLAGCSATATKSPDVAEGVRKALDQAGYKDVSSSQDRDKGVVTLSGHVATDSDKAQAEAITQTIAGLQVVSNQIAVIPPGSESDAKTVNSDLDKGIANNLNADSVKYAVKNHVVTLSGEVASQALRARAEAVASAVLNVQQVVNELQVKSQKATSSK